ncbi:hypothetical protein ACLB1Q_35710 [Escherichia coli]
MGKPRAQKKFKTSLCSLLLRIVSAGWCG